MKGVSSAPGDYVYFKSQVPLHKIPIFSIGQLGIDEDVESALLIQHTPYVDQCSPLRTLEDPFYVQLLSFPCFDESSNTRVFLSALSAIFLEELVSGITHGVIGTKQWRYYDFGPKVVPPLICLPGIAGTADVYYKQVMSLSIKGYRVISVDIPRVWNHHEWIQAFEKFLDAIDVHHVHLYGTSLGGFLAQLFAQHRPRRVRSLLLSNTFLETQSFAAAMPWAPIVSWTPSFLLKRYVLTGIRAGPHEPFIADSVDFVVSQVETLSREDLASRLTLNVDAASVGTLLLSDSFITLMDTNDYCAIPQHLKDDVSDRYPEAKRAHLKNGGDFPFLSRPDEVILHLQLHLRRVSVEAKPELVRGAKPVSSISTQTETIYMSHDSEDQHKNDSGERTPTSIERNNERSKEPKVEEPSNTSYGSDGSEDDNTNENEDQRPSSAASDSKNNLIEELYDPSYDLSTPLALSAESKTQDDLEETTDVDPDSPQESEPKLLL